MEPGERRRILNRAVAAGVVFAALLGGGALAFVVVSGDSWSDAVYRALGAFTASDFVGAPNSGGERAIAAFLTIAGALFYLALFGSVAAVVVRTAATDEFRARRRRKLIQALKGHFIVCGYGQIGKSVVRLLLEAKEEVVVIDRMVDKEPEIRKQNAHFIAGEADEESTLREAGAEHAKGLIACVGSDAENVYIALAARRCKPDIIVVARASDDEAKKNLEELARGNFLDDVISPYESAGRGLVDSVRALGSR